MANHVILDRICHSDKLAACSIEAQLHFPRLYLTCDDWACFEIDIPVIRGDIYPKMPSVTEDDLFGWIKEYISHGLLFAWSDGNSEYGYWTGPEEGRLLPPSRRHKRRTPEPPDKNLALYLQKYKPPTRAYKVTTKCLQSKTKSAPVLNPNPVPKPNHKPKPITSGTPDAFDSFWKVYPRKEDKKKTAAIWAKLNPDTTLTAEIISAVEKTAKTEKWQEARFIPLPSTYLNGKRWQDEISGNGHRPSLPDIPAKWRPNITKLKICSYCHAVLSTNNCETLVGSCERCAEIRARTKEKVKA